MTNNNLFIPVMGTDERVLAVPNAAGAVYFTTDTRKIYLDVDNNKLPMGGNIGLFYGKMKPTGFVADDQTEFEFTTEDLVRDEEDKLVLIPNVNDLILNSDGCFYKVLSVDGVTFNTEKLTIAGTGGGGGSSGGGAGDDSLSSFSVGKVIFSSTNILLGGSCILRFAVKVTDDIGDYVTDDIGYYEIWINGDPAIKNIKLKGISSGDAKDSLSNFNENEINTIDIAPYLPVTENISIGLICYDADKNKIFSRSLSKVSVSAMNLEWKYDNRTVNHWTEEKDFMTLEWSVSGSNLKKNTYISIDDSSYPYLIASGTKDSYSENIKFSDYNLTHGAHTIKMWAEADLGGGDTVPTEPIYKNVIVALLGNNNTIISICLFEKELMQYNTVDIPVYIYNENNIAGTYTVLLIENSILKTTWENVPNVSTDESKSLWHYTPLQESDTTILTVSSGGMSKSVAVAVKGIGIKLEDVEGYAFKFKANEFSSNTDLRNWQAQNGKYTVNFSPNFDWVNKVIDSESDEQGGTRLFVRVKAGTEMNITYPLWKINAPGKGKHIKIIFKANNCRDYDATVLSCKVDKKIAYVDKTEEFLLLTDVETTLDYAESVKVDRNNLLEMMNITYGATLNALSKKSASVFNTKYVKFNDEIYQCSIKVPDPAKPDEFYVAWYKTDVRDSFNGLELKAQNATLKTNDTSVSTLYCEDTYIEFEAEFTAASSGKKYIKMWIDGVPCSYTIYDPTADLFLLEDPIIKIGSPDCDVQIYLIKVYETELSINDHMNNFYVDAPNAEEMLRRYLRNDIMNKSNDKEIDMYALAEKNPECLVHYYEVPKMPTKKDTKIGGCKYWQYQGSRTNKYRAENVMIRVQGTSSEKYVISAANLDTDFNYTKGENPPTGLLDEKGNKLAGWSMSDNAIPITYACTKVNVASCENVNNALNQEWYNKFQPYKSVLRCKNPKARDTMQFTSGIIFVKDNNTTIDASSGVGDNVFKDTPGYIDNPYAKMYALGQMGNSKKNTEVFHDASNPLECCIEVSDNQESQQCMISDEYNKADIGASEKLFEFRYPEKGYTQEMVNAWNDFVSWMAHANPSPKYEKHENIKTEKDYKNFAVNKKTFEKIPTFIMNSEKTAYLETDYNPDIETYYTLTDHMYGYTDLKLPEPKEYGIKEFRGYLAENQRKEDGSLWQAGYTPMIQGCQVKQYAGTYTHDTYEYRMAKMLDECEDHLVMDSILYHYLFIERHCMIDNVAKNTFWSTEDCLHWNLIKDYDNDTADGNDNEGKLTRTYGMEPTDRFNTNSTVFNASRSVWFNFCHGLYEALEHMYKALANNELTLEDGTTANVWDYKAYLKMATKMQSTIPERCWIEDYQRKYFRPNEIYNDSMYNDMLEGGQKKYQRKLFETYQNIYLNSKYEMLDEDMILFRPTGSGLLNAAIPVEVYSDCYVYSNTGSNVKKERVKRNTIVGINCPVDNLQNATMYIHPGSNITRIGTLDKPLGSFAPTLMSFAKGKKLREVIYGYETRYTENTGLSGDISFAGATMLERVYLAGINQSKPTALNLSSCTSLLDLDATHSTFTTITLPNNAPLHTVKLQSPTSLTASNLTKLTNFEIKSYNLLRTIHLENMDSTINFSKNIISKAMDFINGDNTADIIQYKITGAKWLLENAEEMDDINIPLLDKMLDPNYSRTLMDDDNIERLPYSAAFTGELNIPSTIYDGTAPLDIYNQYITDAKFANLDINFESTNAKLYNVIIYDGDNLPFWQKKTTYNTLLDNEFLSSGPNGDIENKEMKKSPSDEFEYKFLKKWIVKDSDGNEITSINNDWPTGLYITEDLYITPVFSQNRRSYTITLKLKNPITKEEKELLSGTFEYGTTFEEILSSAGGKIIPYVDDPNKTLSLYEGYDFKGYSASENSKIVLDESQYKVINTNTFYAVFEYTSEINKIVHPEWFKVILEDNNNTDPDNRFRLTGVTIAPITLNIGGKITIPSTIMYNGKEEPVIGISGFNDYNSFTLIINNTTKLTHVFMDGTKDNTLYKIKEFCFRNNADLEYFDFEKCSVREIEKEAFRNCSNLNTKIFGNQVYCIRQHAFTSALNTNINEINIPGSIEKIESFGIANNLNVSNATLNIGNENNKTNIKLLTNTNINARDTNGIHPDGLKQLLANRYGTINLWSSKYSSVNDLIEGAMTVASWFAHCLILAEGGSVYLNGMYN